MRKAAILLVSLEQPLASQLLAQLDRAAVEAGIPAEVVAVHTVDALRGLMVEDGQSLYGLAADCGVSRRK